MVNKQYLGDGVYVDFDGGCIILTTEYDYPTASNVIYLEPEVYEALKSYIEKIQK